MKTIMQISRVAWLTMALAVISATGLNGCGGAPDDPEQQLRSVILEAERAAERGSTRRLMRHVSENYRDDNGRSKDEIRDYVRAYLFQQDNRRLSTRIEHIEVPTPVRAHAEIQVRLSGNLGQRARAVSGAGGHLRVRLTFDLEADDQWRVVRAEWSEER